MRYRIVHRTTYAYQEPVHESFNEVRLRPVSGGTQTCLNFDLAIDPPATVSTFSDYYGNSVHNFGVPYAHDRLTVESSSEVVTFATADEPIRGVCAGQPDRSPELRALWGDAAFGDDHAEFLSPSRYVALEDASADLARELLERRPDASAHAYFVLAGAYIGECFRYEVGVTTVHSTVADVIEGGGGVCQDFAHLLISVCRHAGVPARYVSGYLRDVAQSTASHAWVEAYVPPYGWVGFDPTAGAACTGRHVKVAVGRDYADVSVVRGTYRGQAGVTLEVEVRSTLLDDARELAAAGSSGGVRGRGKLIQYQTLGPLSQVQRRGAMTQTLGGMSQTLNAAPETMPVRRDEPETPRQQPQQQQQQQRGMGEEGRGPGVLGQRVVEAKGCLRGVCP